VATLRKASWPLRSRFDGTRSQRKRCKTDSQARIAFLTEEYSAAFSVNDRTLPLLAGLVRDPQIKLNFQKLGLEEVFQRQIHDASFDIAECTLGSYLIAISRGETRLTAVPVPLSRRFRQDQIYVASSCTFRALTDLKGKRFGLPEYQATPAIWIRSLLRDNGITADQMQWVTYRAERLPIHKDMERGRAEGPAAGLLGGEIDVALCPRRPSPRLFSLSGEEGPIRRLLADPWSADRTLYRKTRHFPIATVLTIRSSCIDNAANLAEKLYTLFLEAKTSSMQNLLESGQSAAMLPFLQESLEQSLHLQGQDLWPYGFAACWNEIDLFMGFMVEDGLMQRKLEPAEIFHPSVIAT
jgi:4,5-dihydroxyphthalate decarboxylase